MDKAEIQKIKIAGFDFEIPFYYQQIEALPDDPPGAVPFAVVTPYAQCFFIGYEIQREQMIPPVQGPLLDGIRKFLSDKQGIIECDGNGVMSYSIVKTLSEPHGVQYTLSFQEIIGDRIIFIQGSFEEDGTTGLRDSIVYELMRGSDQVGTEEDPFEGWARDPYDETVTTGALMNLSESRQFDPEFPGTPLMICRELVDFLVRNGEDRK